MESDTARLTVQKFGEFASCNSCSRFSRQHKNVKTDREGTTTCRDQKNLIIRPARKSITIMLIPAHAQKTAIENLGGEPVGQATVPLSEPEPENELTGEF